MRRFIRRTIRNLLGKFGYTLVQSSSTASLKTQKKIEQPAQKAGTVEPLHSSPDQAHGHGKLDPVTVQEFFGKNGYYVFRDMIPRQSVRTITDIIQNDISQSQQPMLRHPSNRYEPNTYVELQDGGNDRVIRNALSDPHIRSETVELGSAILDMVCTPRIASALNLIDGADSYTIHQTILFFIGPMTDLHIDGWGLDTDPPGGAFTLWIPLETITLRNGPICVVPWKQGHLLTLSDLGIEALPETEDKDRTAYHLYHRALLSHIAQQDLVYALPQFEVGDFIVFSSLTPHGTLPATLSNPSRLAIQVLVRPSVSRWAAFLPRVRGEVMNGDPKVVKISSQWHVVA